jgi:uncharacterized protein YuzE
MTDEPIHLGFLSLPAEIQDACTVGPEPSGRTRIEIVADELGRAVKVDYEAGMAYFKVRHGRFAWNDVKQEDKSLIVDYDADDNLLGIEVFLVNAAIRPVTVAALKRLLPV